MVMSSSVLSSKRRWILLFIGGLLLLQVAIVFYLRPTLPYRWKRGRILFIFALFNCSSHLNAPLFRKPFEGENFCKWNFREQNFSEFLDARNYAANSPIIVQKDFDDGPMHAKPPNLFVFSLNSFPLFPLYI